MTKKSPGLSFLGHDISFQPGDRQHWAVEAEWGRLMHALKFPLYLDSERQISIPLMTLLTTGLGLEKTPTES